MPVGHASFETMTDAFKTKYSELWRTTDTGFPTLSRKNKMLGRWLNERRLEGFRKELSKNMRHMPSDTAKRYLLNDSVCGMISELENRIVGYDQHLIDYFTSHGYAKITNQFFEEARVFDPEVEVTDIFQAMRNTWIMNSIQLLLDYRVTLTPAVFAYSMLYPYSDNYLDDPYISIREKRAFSVRFRERLEGRQVIAANDLEKLIFCLVSKIEGMFSRVDYPAVYSSLLAIHAAQTRSIAVQNSDAESSKMEILDVSADKGGTSVLADGFLVKPELTLREADFLYGFGFFLQLIDDLQDVGEDFSKGHRTLFTQTAISEDLDLLANRLFHFAEAVFDDEGLFTSEQTRQLRKIMLFSSEMMIIEAVAQNRELFSKSYLRKLEKFSLVRLAYYPKVKRSVRQQYPDRVISKLVAALAY